MNGVIKRTRRRIREAAPQEFLDLWRSLKLRAIHRKGIIQAAKLRGRTNLNLNFGCGPKIKPGWVNIDIDPSADIQLDLRRPLPLETGIAAVVYSEHFLEHLDYPECAMQFLAECCRVLEPGGLFSVGVPDTEWPLLEYARVKDDGYFCTAKERWHPAWCETELEHINYHFRQGTQHRFAYDYATLEKALARSGFGEIRRRNFDPELDSEDRRIGTLYAVATKPS